MEKKINIGSTEWYFLKANQIDSVMKQIRTIEMQIDISNRQFFIKPKWRGFLMLLTMPILPMYYKKIRGLIQLNTK